MTIILTVLFIIGYSQNHSKFTFAFNYGMNGNFFVRGYNETSPLNEVLLYKKNFIGSIGGVELTYKLGAVSKIGVGYSRSVNQGKKNFETFLNGVEILIKDFNITHKNSFFQVLVDLELVKKQFALSYQMGGYLVYTSMQELLIGPGDIFTNPAIIVRERNTENSHLQEAGVFLGFNLTRPVNTQFNIGLNSRVYYTASARFLELVSFTPSLTFNF